MFDETGNPLNYYYDLCEIEDRYNEILDIKNYLLNKCTGYEDNFVPVDLGEDEYGRPLNGITQDDYDYYYALRNEYYEFLKIVAQTDYKNEILTFLSENPNPAYENEDRLNLLFEYFDEIQKVGTIEQNANIYLTVYDADIGQISGSTITDEALNNARALLKK